MKLAAPDFHHLPGYLPAATVVVVGIIIVSVVVLPRQHTSIMSTLSQVAERLSASSSASPSAQTSDIITATPAPATTATFTSEQLGISFTYTTVSMRDPIATRQVNNRVYVYDAKYPYDGQQFVEVISKDAGQNIAQALPQTILKGFNPGNCPISVSKTQMTVNNRQYVRAVLTYAADNVQAGGMVAKDPSKCPADYTPTNWLGYFLYDPTHPTKLLYFHIGQQPIEAGTNTLSTVGWQDTITLL